MRGLPHSVPPFFGGSGGYVDCVSDSSKAITIALRHLAHPNNTIMSGLGVWGDISARELMSAISSLSRVTEISSGPLQKGHKGASLIVGIVCIVSLLLAGTY